MRGLDDGPDGLDDRAFDRALGLTPVRRPRKTVTEYRTALIARRATAAGITVAELLRRGEIELQLNRRASELRFDRRGGWAAIQQRAMAYGRTWAVFA